MAKQKIRPVKAFTVDRAKWLNGSVLMEAPKVDRVQPRVVIGGHNHGGFGRRTRSRQDGGKMDIYNVSVVNEAYQRVNPVTEFEL